MSSTTVAADRPDEYPLMPTYGQPPVQFVRGSGTELFDRDGNRYLDFCADNRYFCLVTPILRLLKR